MVGRARVAAAVLFAGLLLAAQTARPAGDPAFSARRPIRVYNERDGVGSLPFECITQDAKGYLWCGTQDGIQRYNGHEWTRIPLPEADRSAWVFSMCAAADGGMWFGTNGNGLLHWKDGVWTSHNDRTGFPGHWVSALVEATDAHGQPVLWVGTGAEGLWKLSGGRLQPVADPPGGALGAVNALLAGRDGSLWVGSQAGLAHLQGGRWSRTSARDRGLPSFRVNALAEAREPAKPGLWVGTDRGLFLVQDGRWSHQGKEQGLPSEFISTLALEHGENGRDVLWTGTDRGLAILREGRWTTLTTQSGLPSAIIRSLLISKRPGTPTLIWIGTFAGVARLVPGKWLSFTSASGLRENLVFAVREAPDHSFWFASGGGGVLHLAQGVWSAMDNVEGHAITAVFSLGSGHGGDGRPVLYAGSRDAGVLVYDGRRWHMWEHNGELPQSSVYALLETRDASGAPVLWVGTRGGLVRSGRDGLQVFEKGRGLESDHVTALAETRDAQGRPVLWAGTRGGGVARLRDGRWESFGPAQGLSEGRVGSLTAIADARGQVSMWVGTLTKGVARFDPEHPERPWNFLGEAEQVTLPSRNVQTVQADAQGRIYLFTMAGVTRLTPRADGTFACYTYTMGDGLPSDTCTMGSSTVDSQGRIWTGTVSGVAFLDPLREPADTQPKALGFESCLEVGGGAAIADGAVLSHRQNHLQFDFSLLSFYRESETRYQVQLLGMDPAPGPWKAEARQDYASLPDGRYVLKVWARDHAGNRSGPISLAFRIKPAPWRHPLAYVLYAGLLLGAGLTYTRLRIRRLRLRNLELQARVKAATANLLEREARLKVQAERLSAANAELRQLDEEKNRFLGIAAHDLRNPLAGIVLTAQKVREQVDPANVERDLARIVAQAQSMAELIDRFLDVTALETGKIELNLTTIDLADASRDRAYGFLDQARAKQMDLQVQAPDALAVVCDAKYLDQILDNLLSNAIKFSPPGRTIEVRVEAAGAFGRLTVSDQGPGLSEADHAKLFGRFSLLSARPTGGESSLGLGLSIVKGMVDAMGGRIGVHSRKGEGARFWVELPLS